MKKFLTFAGIASSFALSSFAMCGCSQPSSPVATTVPTIQSVDTPVDAQVAETSAPETLASRDEAPAEPMKVKYVAQAKKWGTLRAKFVVDGKVAAPTKVNATDPVCAAFDLMTENLIVGKDGALKNLAIYMDKKSKVNDVHPDLEKPGAAPLLLDNKNCIFVPHVMFVRPGQSIDVKNSDTIGHNANFNFFSNEAVNFLIPSMTSKNLKVLKDEPGTIEVQCNVHPWMKAYLIVQEHPYCGITGDDGVLEIANLPVGKVSFRAWHEKGKLDEVTIGGKLEKWSKNKFELEIKEGMNDLGTIKIAADKLK